MLQVNAVLVRVPSITDCTNNRELIIPEMRSDNFFFVI